MLGRRLRIARQTRTLILLACLCAASCRCTSATRDTEAGARFRELFGATLTNQLLLVTDRHQYQRDDFVRCRVQNRTDHTVWFKDQSFGVQGFAYDDAAKQWIQVRLATVIHPTPIAVEPGWGGVLDYYTMWVEQIEVPKDGKVRLVVTGHTDLQNPYRDQVYTAYTDIEIVK